MARTAKGKPTKVRTVRVDEDVWAALQAMPGVNEGLRAVLIDGAPQASSDDCEHRNVIASLRAEVEALTAENEFLHGEIRATQKPEAPHVSPALTANLKQTITDIEGGTVKPPPPPATKRALSVAEQKALAEKERLKAVAESDVAARATGRDDIEYDVDATPSRSTPATPRTALSQVRTLMTKRKVVFKPLVRPSGNVMGKQRHQGEQGKR